MVPCGPRSAPGGTLSHPVRIAAPASAALINQVFFILHYNRSTLTLAQSPRPTRALEHARNQARQTSLSRVLFPGSATSLLDEHLKTESDCISLILLYH